MKAGILKVNEGLWRAVDVIETLYKLKAVQSNEVKT